MAGRVPRLSLANSGTSHFCFHTCRVLIDKKWRQSPPLTARMENLSLTPMGDTALDLQGTLMELTKPYFPPPQVDTPGTKPSLSGLLLGVPHSPCSTTLWMQYGLWGTSRSLHQPGCLPHHSHRMGSRSQLPSLKSTLRHTEFVKGCKVLGSLWNTQGICFA